MSTRAKAGTVTARTHSPRTIAMLNQKGGVGKTTSAVNLGAALAVAGQRVLSIDLDPQAHLTLHYGVDAERVDRTVYDLLIDPECTAEDAIVTARDNGDIIIAETDLAGAETELAAMPDREGILKRKLAPVMDRYDIILIDCPPSLGLLTLNALALTDEVFVPMQAHFLALQGVGKLLETVGLVSRSVNPDLRVTGIILCMHEGNTTLAREIVSDLDAFFDAARDEDVPWRDCRVLRPPIRRNIKLAEAPSFGKTIFDYEPWCAGALDYKALARRLLAHWNEVRIESHSAGRTSSPTANDAPANADDAVVDDTSVADAPVSNTQSPSASEAEVKPMCDRTTTDASEPTPANGTAPVNASLRS